MCSVYHFIPDPKSFFNQLSVKFKDQGKLLLMNPMSLDPSNKSYMTTSNGKYFVPTADEIIDTIENSHFKLIEKNIDHRLGYKKFVFIKN